MPGRLLHASCFELDLVAKTVLRAVTLQSLRRLQLPVPQL
jgi:hypothetical protein